jgi:hypothetical protein
MKKQLIGPAALTVGAAILGLIVIGPPSAQRPQVEAAHSHEAATMGQSAGPASLVATTGEQLLEVAKRASRFADIDESLDRGYENINVFLPNMGCHYLNARLLDGRFDHKRPELLVYAEEPGRDPLLVAVEYAVPLAESPNSPPEGFAGDHDVWSRNETFQLWTLHAWVFLPNPAGVFAAENALVTQESPDCGLRQDGDSDDEDDS